MTAPTPPRCDGCGHPDHTVLVACPGTTGQPCGCTTTRRTAHDTPAQPAPTDEEDAQ